MSATENREIMQSIYRDAAKGDLGFVERYLASDCMIHESPGLPYGGTYRGPQGLVDVFARIHEAWSPFSFEPLEFIADGDYVVVLLTASGASRKTGRAFTLPLAEFWRFSEGKSFELRTF